MDASSLSGPIDPGLQWSEKSAVAIIGGQGEMGRLFTKFFTSYGFPVQVADLDTPLTPECAMRESDIVVFAVPLHKTVAIIGELVSLARPGQLLMDLTSLKSAPVKEMLRSPASVVGLHPMFGGRVATFAGQTLAACPARISPQRWQWLRGLFVARGIRVKECTPEEHDRMMSIIQVLFHLMTMLAGRTLRKLGIDIRETLEYTSPIYRIEMNLAGRIFAQSPELYAAITQMNPNTGQILAQLKESLEVYEDFYKSEDLQGIMDDFSQSADHLGDFCSDAYRESSALLDFSVELANNIRNGSNPRSDK
ncbi:MAG: prephenate dehydrogenase/arogenate dehydrogenase family protein [Syntrophobacteraceae bacterium]|nr:prephenate dehydrogenase/arogenate dehydrogenase family protein [Syntrophobacteraceae bacterium]